MTEPVEMRMHDDASVGPPPDFQITGQRSYFCETCSTFLGKNDEKITPHTIRDCVKALALRVAEVERA